MFRNGLDVGYKKLKPVIAVIEAKISSHIPNYNSGDMLLGHLGSLWEKRKRGKYCNLKGRWELSLICLDNGRGTSNTGSIIDYIPSRQTFRLIVYESAGQNPTFTMV